MSASCKCNFPGTFRIAIAFKKMRTNLPDSDGFKTRRYVKGRLQPGSWVHEAIEFGQIRVPASKKRSLATGFKL